MGLAEILIFFEISSKHMEKGFLEQGMKNEERFFSENEKLRRARGLLNEERKVTVRFPDGTIEEGWLVAQVIPEDEEGKQIVVVVNSDQTMRRAVALDEFLSWQK